MCLAYAEGDLLSPITSVIIRGIVALQPHRDVLKCPKSFKLLIAEKYHRAGEAAAFLVWQIRESKAMPEQIETQANKISDSREKLSRFYHQIQANNERC